MTTISHIKLWKYIELDSLVIFLNTMSYMTTISYIYTIYYIKLWKSVSVYDITPIIAHP